VTAHHLMVAVAAAHPLAAGTGNLHKINQITSENALLIHGLPCTSS
jgi:outer membrane murein-binding lipoprotein Lpp